MGMKLTVKGMADFTTSFDDMVQRVEPAAKMAVFDGMAILADKVRNNLETNLAGSVYSTGSLLSSLGITKIEVNGNTVRTVVGFADYDDRGIANAIKANVMESGSSKQKKKPFLRPAVTATKEPIKEKMQDTFYKQLTTRR